MASGAVAISDVIVPQIFSPYTQQMTTQKSRLIRSGAVVEDAYLNNFLAGDGITINAPSFKDLDDDAENVSSDTGSDSTPNKLGTAQEIAVRLSRNNSWKSADLVSALIDKDPLQAIATRVSDYWTRRKQGAFIAVMKGIFANNAAATDAFHTQNDMTSDISSTAFSAGVTSFSAEAFIDATTTMGDSMDELTMVAVHSIVYARMLKNNLIDFIPDSTNPNAQGIPTFLGRIVMVDDAMPVTSGVFETWLFGAGAVRMGIGAPKVATEVKRYPEANNGGGAEALFNRVEWCLHPAGHAYIGTPANGGPSNAATTNNLAAAGSWKRVFTERKQIKIARLITREF
jgi:hypothetical protein